MVKIKQRPPSMKVEAKIENRLIEQKFRRYLGCSSIGHPCDRKLWFQFRCFKKTFITPRQARLFARGHREEPIIHADFNEIGIKVSGLQKPVSFACGHGGGHCDGILKNVPGHKKLTLLNEIKTANEKNFNLARKLGIRKWKVEYFGQAQSYMKLYGLKRCLFIVVNKNDDSRYYEIIDFEPVTADIVITRAHNIIFYNNLAPRRMSEDRNFYMCNWCDYQEICFEKEKYLKHCRTCKFSKTVSNAQWHCTRKGKAKVIPWHKKEKENKQLKSCKHYKKIY